MFFIDRSIRVVPNVSPKNDHSGIARPVASGFLDLLALTGHGAISIWKHHIRKKTKWE